MNNLIGIAGVFVLTFSLIGLYHCISAFGRHGKRDAAHLRAIKNPDEHSRASHHDERRRTDTDYSWLLWNSELETDSDQSDIDHCDEKKEIFLR